MLGRRWDPSSDTESSDSGSSSSSSSSSVVVVSEISLRPAQLQYLDVGEYFLRTSKLQWWFDAWDASIPFNYTSDCFLSASYRVIMSKHFLNLFDIMTATLSLSPQVPV